MVGFVLSLLYAGEDVIGVLLFLTEFVSLCASPCFHLLWLLLQTDSEWVWQIDGVVSDGRLRS